MTEASLTCGAAEELAPADHLLYKYTGNLRQCHHPGILCPDPLLTGDVQRHTTNIRLMYRTNDLHYHRVTHGCGIPYGRCSRGDDTLGYRFNTCSLKKYVDFFRRQITLGGALDDLPDYFQVCKGAVALRHSRCRSCVNPTERFSKEHLVSEDCVPSGYKIGDLPLHVDD